MRNVDKIKSLNNQIEALIRRREELSKEVEKLHKANMEIQAASNAVVISIAIACGEKQEDGSFTLTFPKADLAENISKYRIKARAEGDMRIITVSPSKEAESGTNAEGH